MGILSALIDKFSKKEQLNKNIDVSIKNGIASGNDIVVYAPKTIMELNNVIDCAKNGQAVIVNFASIKKNEYLSAIDYLSGALYAIGANISRLQDELFIITPTKVALATIK